MAIFMCRIVAHATRDQDKDGSIMRGRPPRSGLPNQRGGGTDAADRWRRAHCRFASSLPPARSLTKPPASAHQQEAGREIPGNNPNSQEAVITAGGDIGEIERGGAEPAHPAGRPMTAASVREIGRVITAPDERGMPVPITASPSCRRATT